MRRERKNVILVDTGDLLHSRSSLHSPHAPKLSEFRADLYLKCYNLMGYDAFTPGELDLSLGVKELLRMSKKAKFPFLAANLLDNKSRKPIFRSYLVKEVGGIKVGLLGLISRRLPLRNSPGEKVDFHIADPVETARQIVADLKNKQCQAIAVLGHMDVDEQEMLAQAVPGIQFILSGHVPHFQLDPMTVQDTQIFIAGSRGENLGQVDFLMEENKPQSRFRLVSLTTNFADHPQVLEWVNQYKTQVQSLQQVPPRPAPSRPRAGVTPQVIIPLTPLFLGEKSCLPCHKKHYQHWLNTAHARAYQTLIAKNKTTDPLCLACHTTGYGAPLFPKGPLENVQCEACHGPGEGHSDRERRFPPVTQDQCLNCHNPANSPNFNFATYLEKIRHPK